MKNRKVKILSPGREGGKMRREAGNTISYEFRKITFQLLRGCWFVGRDEREHIADRYLSTTKS